MAQYRCSTPANSASAKPGVRQVASQLGVVWCTIMDQVIDRGEPVVNDPDRLADTEAVGVDESAFLRATGQHPTLFATGITDLAAGRVARLFDVVEGRSGTVLATWLAERPQDWREQIGTASIHLS